MKQVGSKENKMARYPSSSYDRRRGRTRRWTYIFIALLVIAVALVVIYPPFGKNSKQTSANLTETDLGGEAKPLVAVRPRPQPEPDLSNVLPGPTAEPNSQVDELIKKAVTLINAKPARIIEARNLLNQALPMQQSRRQRMVVKEHISKLADEWLFSRKIFPPDGLCSTYKVKSGDQLRIIGNHFKVPWEILQQINKLPSPQALRAGEVIKVINGPFHVRVYRSTFTMDLYLQDTFVKSFPVGLGKPGMETPTGLWIVKPGGKLIKPRWTDPITNKTYEPDDPNYPLGSRWIGLEGVAGQAKGRTGFAIHGTNDPQAIGTADSQGCIRVQNGNAKLLYNLLMPGLSKVEVVE